jgi:hypothetical protein
MNVGEWKEAILLVLGFVLSIGAGIIGAYIQRRVDRRADRRPLNQLLDFGPDSLLFIFPHRDTSPEAILPRTSTEDFLAMNNFISALLKIGWSRKIGVRDTTRVSEADKRRNLVIICSPKSNSIARTFQQELRKSHANAFAFESIADRICVIDGDGARYESKSYEQVKQYVNSGINIPDLPSKSYEDYAVLTKVTSPWNERMKIVWVAGIRGIGTWGAAECIKKEWRQIYEQLPPNRKSCDFSALLKIEYDNCDITSVEVRRVELLGQKKTV